LENIFDHDAVVQTNTKLMDPASWSPRYVVQAFLNILRKKGTKAVTGAVPFQKYLKGAYWYLNGTY